jgi:DNA-binding GntR family transcriptional regulator
MELDTESPMLGDRAVPRRTRRGGGGHVADRVYAELRQRILDGRHRLNEHLVETDLALDLASSRTPIRQALQRLEIEGLVIAARSGWMVREHTVDDIVHVYDVRLPLEGYAAYLAAERADEADLQGIADLNTAMRAMTHPDQRHDYVRLHDEFHDAILRATRNEVLRSAIQRYRDHPYNRRVAHLYTDEELLASGRSHDAMVAALLGRDAALAEQRTREHLELSREVTIRRLRRLG